MESFSFKPDPEAEERIRVRLGETRVWFVEFDPLVRRVFCATKELAAVTRADYGVAWTGVSTHHWPTTKPTDREGVWCVEFAAPIERMAVNHDDMPGWMAVVRANGCHGRYREAGVRPRRWYEF